MSTDVAVTLEIVKRDVEQRLAYGWVAVVEDADGNPLIDSDGHVVPIVELQKAVHSALAESGGRGKGGDLHERQGLIDVVETSMVTQELRKAADSPFADNGPSGWWAGFRVNDDAVWSQIKSGERPELSLRGTGRGVALEKRHTDIIKSRPKFQVEDIELNKLEWFSTVDRGASGDAQHRPQIVLWKRDQETTLTKQEKSLFERLATKLGLMKQEQPMPTLEEILATLPEEAQKVIMAALDAAKAAPVEPAMPAAPAAPPAPEGEPKPEEIAKRADLPKDVRDALVAQAVELKKRNDEQVELKKRLDAMEDERVTIELRKRVDETMQFIPGDPAELVELLKRAKPDDAEKWEARMVMMSKAMRKSPMLTALGTGAADINDPDPTIQLEKRASDKVKADPKLSMSQAKMQVLAENPELHAEITGAA